MTQARATSLVPPNESRDDAIEAMRLDAEIEGRYCVCWSCQGPPICPHTRPKASDQESCPYCRCDTFDPETGWTTRDPLAIAIQ